MEDLAFPGQHAEILVNVNVSNPDGILSEGFGSIVVRAGAGREVLVEITDDLSGITTVATLDFGKGIRARRDLQSDVLCRAVQEAARDNGISDPMPTPR